MRRLWVLVFLLLAVPALAAGENCPVGGDASRAAIDAAPSCSAAMKQVRDCPWGSGMDNILWRHAMDKCEAGVFARLTPAERRHLDRADAACTRKVARQSGTMAVSAAALCRADAAMKLARRKKG
ncbi:MAG TPA: hypothetical protein PK812_02160 [Beijerinckiaceae bacterium]|nr:hypothetical protein [Beijerinckiaceae bacterium]